MNQSYQQYIQQSAAQQIAAQMQQNSLFGGGGLGGAQGYAGLIPQVVQPQPAPHIEPASIKLGEIIGWRCWKVDGGLIKSMAADILWAPGDPMKHNSKLGSILADTSGGVHAWFDATGAINYLRDYAAEPGPFIVGKVALWGDVIEHERGYRAEFAKPVSFEWIIQGASGTGGIDAVLDVMRKRYGLGPKA